MTLALVLAVAPMAPAQSRAPRASKTVAPARPSAPPSTDSLDVISRRGKVLAERDSIAWLGADAMTSLSLPEDHVRRLIVRRAVQGWVVATGQLAEDGREYLIEQLATPGIQASRWASTLFDPPRPDTEYFASAARAIETALIMFRPVAPRPYIATAVPAEDGPSWWVYLYPAPARAGVWPRGGDMRFRVSADGRVMTESRRLHEAITEYSVRTARSASAPGAYRQPAVSGDAPEDTDVFHVLQRRPALPELMTAGRFRYRIDVDGSIRRLAN